MKHNLLFTLSIAIIILFSCQKDECIPPDEDLYYPSEELGELFHDIQLSGVFSDGKTFVDYIPKCEPSGILENYQNQKSESGFYMGEFINEYFSPFPEGKVKVIDHSQVTMEEYLREQWENLIKSSDTSRYMGSLIPLPNPYVVPGGRFREVYYWDSYFTMLGLAQSGELELIQNMIDNFAFLIENYGRIPNGNRSYYLSRSQPPYFSLMVNLLANYFPEEEIAQYLPALEKEYQFWMEGSEELTSGVNSKNRVVLLDSIVLNRHWDDKPIPRPESHKEDYELALGLPDEEKPILYRNLKAGAESGWDFSSRWFEDQKNRNTIRIIEILPVDLNSLLYSLEQTIADLYEAQGDIQKWSHYNGLAQIRKKAINQYFWNEELDAYADYDFINQRPSDQLTAAAATPLFFGLADEDKAAKTIKAIEQQLLLDGGIVTTLHTTGEQWDFPNGWAPLQWIAIKGLLNYGEKDLALEVASRWVGMNRKVFRNTGKMMEKYNVADTTLIAGGGEYELQDGFGWTNGVALQLLDVFPELQTQKEEAEVVDGI